MQFDEFKQLAKGLKSVYTSDRFLPDADSLKIWYQMLRDLNYDVCSAAIQSYILTNKFPPTIADIRNLAVDVQNGHALDWGEGWEQVLSAIRKFGMYRISEAMDSMDGITRKCVERLGFQNICMSENINTDRANFRMLYEQIAEREKKNNQIPDGLKLTMQTIREGLEHKKHVASLEKM